MIRHNLLLSICAAGVAFAAPLELTRPARHWEFMDTVGPRAAVLGTESGTCEASVYPLKLLRDFRLVFTLDGRQRLPTTVIGLLTHIAEHTQRHLGQAISAAKLARR